MYYNTPVLPINPRGRVTNPPIHHPPASPPPLLNHPPASPPALLNQLPASLNAEPSTKKLR